MIQVAAAIIKDNGKILICRRAEGGNCSLLWEFPGGKQEEGENLEQCLVREVQEELELKIEVKGIFAETTYTYGEQKMGFTFFYADIVEGIMKKKVHQDTRWVVPQELENFEFCPADVEIVKKLALE